MNNLDEHRKFLHEFANQLTVCDGAFRRIKKELSKDAEKEVVEGHVETGLKYMSNLTKTLRDYRQFITDLDNKA